MRVVRESDVSGFLERVGPRLRERPGENNLMLGLLGDLARLSSVAEREATPGVVPPVLLVVEGARGIEGVALQTPPRALIVSRARDDAMDALVEFVLSSEILMSGVLGPDATAQHFATVWAARTGSTAVLRMAETAYELARVRAPGTALGQLREARAGDEKLLAAWSEAFHREAGLDAVPDHLVFIRAKMAARQFYLWEHAAPLSMAAWGGRTEVGVRVQYVYTPPPERKKGYASAVVAALSQRLLDEGSPRCFLFANAANATSNKIYRSLGYQPVCDFRLYDFS